MCSLCQLTMETCERCGAPVAAADSGFFVAASGLTAEDEQVAADYPRTGETMVCEFVDVPGGGNQVALVPHTLERCLSRYVTSRVTR